MKLIVALATTLALAACQRDVDLRPPSPDATVPDAAFDTDAEPLPDAAPPDAGP